MALTFTVEDGTGLATSNSYIAETYVDDYVGLRGGNAAWTALTQSQKQAACVKATDYIETVYSTRFLYDKNVVTAATQALSFPRNEVNVVPIPLQKATAEYALRAFGTSPLLPDPVVDATGAQVVSIKKAVGPIDKEITYSDTGGVIQPIHPYPAADYLLKPLIRASGQSIRN